MSLPKLPPFPAGVQYALTVPQSVLFADLSLRGSRRPAFNAVFGTDFEVPFVVIDDGAMSWDFSGDDEYCRALCGTTNAAISLRRFIGAMGETARAVEKTSWLVSSSASRRAGSVDDIAVDLTVYWDAYERHMTSLFPFWNIEHMLGDTLTQLLRAAGLTDEITSGLQRFLQPSETNYFALERRHLRRLAWRFKDVTDDASAKQEALEQHAAMFGFLLAPFNLGSPPSIASIRERLQEEERAVTEDTTVLLNGRPDFLTELGPEVRELGLLAQEFAFWKTERLDVMALGDARATDLYTAAAEVLQIGTEHLFAMTREEIEESLIRGAPAVDGDILRDRLAGYCLMLDRGEITFCAPSQRPSRPAGASDDTGDVGEIAGIPASSGIAVGPVRILTDLAQIHDLESGDVLVTTMTRPEMGAALDRASAFVTDEGGLMCHAAIISREMKKPCVIGTGDASTRLRNGMTVTVDGDAGTVTVLPDSQK